MRRRHDGIVLSIEHRAAASPPPVTMALVDADGPVRLELRETPVPAEEAPLSERIVRSLEVRGALRKEDLRHILRVRNQDLAEALHDLEGTGRIVRTVSGWTTAANGPSVFAKASAEKSARSGSPGP
ncbi:MAG: hypothetical protein HYY16_16645 [Planctomycetes bacterium]|nr:hypothetical protein [Planctomycetota bacterium]